MLNKYNMSQKLFLILIISLHLLSCDQKKNKEIIDSKIAEQLAFNKNVDNIFLNIKFGMDKSEFNSSILEQKSIGKVSFDLDQYAYQFKNNPNLEGINWFVGSKMHNDTLIGISLTAYKDLSSSVNLNLTQVYKETVQEYITKYGTPNHSDENYDKYWFINNLEINIVKTDGKIIISYEDTRRRKSIDWQKCRFDADYNSQDAWYYEKMKEDKIVNDDI